MNNKKQKVFEMINMTKMAADGFMRKKRNLLHCSIIPLTN